MLGKTTAAWPEPWEILVVERRLASNDHGDDGGFWTMNRRRFLLGSAAAGLTVGASGTAVLVKGFDPPPAKKKPPEQLLPDGANGGSVPWTYHELNPERTAERAYQMYKDGSCMYAVFGSIITQLAEEFGEPYSSFPVSMMKYGASGIGSFGSICGSLNAAAAAIGLFVGKKEHQEALIEDLFTWYEKALLPVYTPPKPEHTIIPTVADSVLCHASTAKWLKASGGRIDGKERAERCSRLSADVAQKAVGILNRYHANQYVTASEMNPETAGCIQCHGKSGKLGSVGGKMDCAACHDTTVPHALFADVHYKYMEKRP